MDVPVRFIDSIINNPLLMQFLVHRWFFLLEYDPRLDQLRVYDTRSRTLETLEAYLGSEKPKHATIFAEDRWKMRALLTGELYGPLEMRFVSPEGVYYSREVDARPVEDPARGTLYVGYAKDITDQKNQTQELLEQVLEAGRYAPSGKNVQAAHFLVIENRAILDRLAVLVREAFQEAGVKRPEGYIFHYDPKVLIVLCNRTDNVNNLADTGCALENMMLMASELELGSCWINQLKDLNGNETINACIRWAWRTRSGPTALWPWVTRTAKPGCRSTPPRSAPATELPM